MSGLLFILKIDEWFILLQRLPLTDPINVTIMLIAYLFIYYLVIFSLLNSAVTQASEKCYHRANYFQIAKN